MDKVGSRYGVLIGTGGIGTGSFFAVEGNETLGREESRKGRFLANRDYAKLHIVAHYVRVLMGRAFRVAPVGRVGNDDEGHALLNEMTAAGLDMRYVEAIDGAPTMTCICIVYPDGSGGNLTTGDSACDRLTPADIQESAPLFQEYRQRGIVMALPEAPLAARGALLELGAQHGFLRAASFTSEELRHGLAPSLLGLVELLVLNRDEAAALAGADASAPVAELLDKARGKVGETCRVIVTAGRDGSLAWDGAEASFQHAYQANTVSAAGAGDAFLAGVLAGTASGLGMAEAQQLGALTGALSTESPHTISPYVDRRSLRAFADRQSGPVGEGVFAFLDAREKE